MADHNETNNYPHGDGSLDSQRQPDPVADSVRLAQEKGSTHQFSLPEVHDVSHMSAMPPSQTSEGQSINETTGAGTGSGRKRTTKKASSAAGSKRASSAKKTTPSSKRTTSKGTRSGTHAQRQATGRQSHKK